MSKRRPRPDVTSDGDGDSGFSVPPLPPPASEPPPPPQAEAGESYAEPVHVIRFGVVRACVWLNHTEFGPRHHVTVSRLYKGSDGRWCSSESFGYRDLLTLAKCLDWAHSY